VVALRVVPCRLASAKGGAYSPYSRFPVGACLLAANGILIKGGSIDNASYGECVYILPVSRFRFLFYL
jgi:cytidine deaminase